MSKYVKQILTELKGETDKNIIVEDFNTPLYTIYIFRQKIKKEMLDLNHPSDQ